MKALIIAIFPVGCFLLGWFTAKLQRRPPEQRFTDTLVRDLHRADALINDLSAGATEHSLYGELFAIIAAEKITKYRHERKSR